MSGGDAVSARAPPVADGVLAVLDGGSTSDLGRSLTVACGASPSVTCGENRLTHTAQGCQRAANAAPAAFAAVSAASSRAVVLATACTSRAA